MRLSVIKKKKKRKKSPGCLCKDQNTRNSAQTACRGLSLPRLCCSPSPPRLVFPWLVPTPSSCLIMSQRLR